MPKASGPEVAAKVLCVCCWPKFVTSRASGLIVASGKPESNRAKKGLRDRNSPMCTLSQNGYGARRSELNCAEEIVLAALEAPADDTMIRASTIGHQEIQQAVAFSTGHAVLKAGPDWAATVAAAKSGARQRAQK